MAIKKQEINYPTQEWLDGWIDKYLDNHPDATDVYLVMVPMDDVSRNFNIEYAYQYDPNKRKQVRKPARVRELSTPTERL